MLTSLDQLPSGRTYSSPPTEIISKGSIMDVKEAVNKAMVAASDLFGQEMLNNLLLEEVDLDEQTGAWQITLGFDVPNTNPLKGLGATLSGERMYIRKYKVFHVDATGNVKSVKIRTLS